ncbi:MAG TPA: DUF4870 domain-containing protein [Candidatus Angelobacter sp.]|nr:DUF4870 domain-containing protein [Candidatus Angelobacter sp.]
MSDAPLTGWLDTTPDERTMATLAHALQLVGSWIAPLIIFLIRRQSRFVAFHALQALLLQIIHTILLLVIILSWFALMFFYVIPQNAHSTDFSPALLVIFPLVWIVFAGMWVGMLVIAIVYAVRAGRGEWADYPLLGRLARKILKMEPKTSYR